MIQFKAININITPDFPSRMTYMNLDETNKGIHSDLEINAMLFKQNEQNVFFISIDTLFINNDIKKFIREEINKIFGSVDDSEILIMSTHTHYAPTLEEKRIEFGKIDDKYYAFLKIKIINLVRLLNDARFSPVEVEVQRGKTRQLTANRRRRVRSVRQYFKTFIAMEPDIKGFKNEEFKIVKIIDTENNSKLLGVIWTFPCHPTNLFEKQQISAEFPGDIRRLIRNNENYSELPVIYMPGFAGNIRAYPPKRLSVLKIARDILNLSYPVKYYRFTSTEEYESWINLMKKSFLKIWESTFERLSVHDCRLWAQIKTKDLASLGISVEDHENIIFRKVSFDNELAIYTISAEPVSEYSCILDKLSTEKFCIYTGYTDDVFGYLPTKAQVIEGGYESSEYFESFFITGNFSLDIEKTIESCIREMN